MPTRFPFMPATVHPFYSPEEGGGGAAEPSTPPATPPADPEPLGEAGKKALESEREARKAAEKAAKETQAELDRLRAEAQKRADAEAAEQGKWKELADKREADLTSATTTLTTATERLTVLEQLATDRLDALLANLPKEIADLGPDADTPIEKRLAWAEKAAKAAETAGASTPGNGPNPKPANGAFDRDAAIARARRTGTYRV